MINYHNMTYESGCLSINNLHNMIFLMEQNKYFNGFNFDVSYNIDVFAHR